MSHSDCPPMSEAMEAFRKFLAREGHSPDLMWVFREEVVEIWPNVYVRVPHADRLSAVAGIYQEGLNRGLGIHLNVFCLLNGRPCCYVWIPEDEDDAAYRLLSGLKLSVPIPSIPDRPEPPIARPVRNPLRWRWLKSREARSRGIRRAAELPNHADWEPQYLPPI